MRNREDGWDVLIPRNRNYTLWRMHKIEFLILSPFCRGKIEKSKEEIDLVHSLHMLQRRVPLSTSKLIQDFIYVFKRSGKYSYWCIVHNLSGCDNLVTIWVANQSSSIISTVGGCLNSLGEGSFFFFPIIFPLL